MLCPVNGSREFHVVSEIPSLTVYTQPAIMTAIQPAKHLMSLRFQMQWTPPGFGRYTSRSILFTAEDAEKMMLRSETSVLRVIAIGTVLYTVSRDSMDIVHADTDVNRANG